MLNVKRGAGAAIRGRMLPALAILVTVSGVSVSVARGGVEDLQDPATQRAAVQTKAPQLPGLVRAFQRDQAEDDRIPGDPLGALQASGTLQAGEDPTLARRLGASKDPAWVWPANGRVCYALKGMGGCVGTADLRDRGVLISATFQSADPTVTLFGLVAPGVRGVAVELTDGTTVTPEVVDDSFVLTVTSDPVRATWTNPGGAAGVQQPLVVRSAG